MNVVLIDLWPFAIATLITQIAYALYRKLFPKSSAHHKRFIIFAALLTLAGNSLLFVLAPPNFILFILLLPFLVLLPFTVYKLVMMCDGRKRTALGLSLFILISLWLAQNMHLAYKFMHAREACGITNNWETSAKSRLSKIFNLKPPQCVGQMGQMKF